MSLTNEEKIELMRLMYKAEFPLPRDLFYAWCQNFAVPCVEIAILREGANEREIYLTYRDDEFFKGWHIPGAVVQAGETVEEVFERIARDELQGAECTRRFFSWFEYLQGSGAGQSARGHAISLVFSADAPSTIRESDTAKFFPFSKIPDDLISEHVPVVDALRNR